MANILGGIAVSHTPTIGFAVDHHKQQDPAWAPIFQSFEPLQRWLEEKKPDALVYIFNDHVTAFFFDHYSTFTLGIDSQYDVADEGGGPRCLICRSLWIKSSTTAFSRRFRRCCPGMKRRGGRRR